MEENSRKKSAAEIRSEVSSYYSELTTKKEGKLASNVCCCASDAMPDYVRKTASMLPDEITTKFYGCGSPIPDAIEGCTVLDLGCGTGRDVFIASRLAGADGRVIGVDMNDDQLAIARKYRDYIAELWGFANTEFIHGYIEDLSQIPDSSVDVVISNCVVNLSPDKRSVFSEIWRVLKDGGELCFSDIYADRRVPEEISDDPLLLGECLGGSLYAEDFRRLMEETGWKDIRLVSTAVSPIDNPEIEKLTGDIRFRSQTFRAFKLPGLAEDAPEYYGQTACYRGGITGSESSFILDVDHGFSKGGYVPVSGNTAAILSSSRFRKYFTVTGDRSVHYGAFPERAWVSGFGEEEEEACCCCEAPAASDSAVHEKASAHDGRRTKYVVMSGFLGSGKTTSMIALGRSINRRSLGTAGILVDDLGAKNIVDADFTSMSGIITEDISGDCICYQHENLVDKLHQLESQGSDVIFSDIPGLGIGALDNVYLQLCDREPGEFDLMPFTCLVDPKRIAMLMDDDDINLPDELKFLLDAQMAEADLIVLNKIDTITGGKADEIISFIKERYPDAEVMKMSALRGDGVDEVADYMLSHSAAAEHREIGYGSEQFIAAESTLSWYNRRIFFEQKDGKGLDFNDVLTDLFEEIRNGLRKNDSNVPHLKMFAADDPEKPDDFFKASLIGIDCDVEVTHALTKKYTALSVIINARAAAQANVMSEIVEEALGVICEKYGLKSKTFFLESFGMTEEGRGNMGRASRF